ncbi:unnamed protein product [Lampetra fluviatilis]
MHKRLFVGGKASRRERSGRESPRRARPLHVKTQNTLAVGAEGAGHRRPILAASWSCSLPSGGEHSDGFGKRSGGVRAERPVTQRSIPGHGEHVTSDA